MSSPRRSLHILFLSDNFPPETNAPATRLHEHAREWIALGHRVTVVTGAPTGRVSTSKPSLTNDSVPSLSVSVKRKSICVSPESVSA